jgi:transcription elongation factor Elf1
MAEIPCPTCGRAVAVDARAEEGAWATVGCAGCGERIRYRVGSPASTAGVAFDAPIEYPPGSRPEGEGEVDAYSTLFHPRAALGFGYEEDSEAAAEEETDGEAEAAGEGPGGTLHAGTALPPPAPPPTAGAGFLVLGAPPGSERIPLPSARTLFGRKGADVDLDDAAVSRRHFQVEVAGRDYFVRDLDSSNGTFVNGRRVRYAELLDGDEVRAGQTFLVFRCWAGS